MPKSRQTPGANREPAGRRARPRVEDRTCPSAEPGAFEGLEQTLLSQAAVAGGQRGQTWWEPSALSALAPHPGHPIHAACGRGLLRGPTLGVPYRALDTPVLLGVRGVVSPPPEEAGGPARPSQEKCTQSQAAVPTTEPLTRSPPNQGGLQDGGGQASSTAGMVFPLRWGSRAEGQDPEKWAREAGVGAGPETVRSQAGHQEPAAPRATSPDGVQHSLGAAKPGARPGDRWTSCWHQGHQAPTTGRS